MNTNYEGGINIGLSGKYRLQVVDAETSAIVSDYGWHKNLILNNGMDAMGNPNGPLLASLSSWGVSGTGSRPNYITSSTSTITQSGAFIGLTNYTGLTSFTQSVTTNGTASYTSSVEVGDLIVDQSLSQSTVVGVSGSILYVTCSSLTYTTPKTFTIWKTSQYGLQGESQRSANYLPGSSSLVGWNCGTVFSGSTVTYRRTFNFATEVASQSYNEVGCSWNGNTNGGMFSRIVLPQTVVVAPNQLLRMTYDLQTSFGPFYSVYKTASITGWPVLPATDTSGTESLQNLIPSLVDINGNVGGYQALDPVGGSSTFCVFASNVNSPLYTGSANTQSAVYRLGDFSSPYNGLFYGPYVNGTYTTVKYGTLSIYQATSSQLYSIGFGIYQQYGPQPYDGTGQAMTFVFNQPQTKTNLQTLTLGWRWTWSRTIQ